MEPARSIKKLGFRKWYERQLIEAHAWLVSCLLCGIAIAACLEAVSFREAPRRTFVLLAFVFVAVLVCWHALKRYGAIMVQAERLGEHSTCAQCHAYAAFDVLADQARIPVRCRNCSHEWLIDPPQSIS